MVNLQSVVFGQWTSQPARYISSMMGQRQHEMLALNAGPTSCVRFENEPLISSSLSWLQS